MQSVLEAGSMLQTAACTARCGTSSRGHRQRAGAFTSRRPRQADVVIGQRSYRHIVAAKSPLNEGSSDADVLAAQAAGENPPGVLDELAGAVKGAAVSVARQIVDGADPGAAANLMPDGGDGTGVSLDKSPAAQAASSAANGADDAAGSSSSSRDVDNDAQDGGNDAIVGSQEWLAPQQKLPDQTPPEADNDGVSGNGAQNWALAAPAQSDQQQQLEQQQQQQQQQQPQQSGQLAQPQQQRPSEEQLDAAVAQLPEQQRAAAKAKLRSSWDAKDARGGGGDYLFELGQADYNTNVDVGATAALGLDSLFHGNAAFGLGSKSDIADGSLRGFEFRKYDNLYGDYYISPQFLEAVTMHIAKNFMWESLGGSRVPVILGIWGPKGCGKTFMTELAFKKLGVEPIIMSAGELEHEWAGTPGRLVRERYRKASELSRVRGKLSCLLINDLDAGLGHFEHTQVTVNNQNVVGTLMNIADEPTRVSGGGSWREAETLRRIPIIVTGNDFSTLYAPLIRQGRMEQFYWKPNRTDLLAILTQMYKEDNVSRSDLEQLLDTFPDQPLDFYGAIRAATYDNQIRKWIKEDVAKAEEINEDTDLTELGKRLLNKDRLPAFNTDHVNLGALLAEGRRLRAEQEAVGSQRLAKEYMNDTGFRGQSMIGLGG